MQGEFTMLRCGSTGIQAVAASTRHVFQRHSHEQFGIGVIDSGAQKSLSGRGVVEAGAGDVITVNPGEVHDGAPIGDAGRSWRMLYFDPEIVVAAVEDMREGISPHCEFHRPAMTDAGTADLFRRLFAAMTKPHSPELRRDELLPLLLARVIGERTEFAGAPTMPAAIVKARQLIDDAPTAALTLADLAEVSGLSRFQLVRRFAKATGFTPHAYMLQRRADLARRLIARGARLADAAAESRFADQAHMTRVFTRKYGVSPGVYATALA
ncbi:AraC family transcriptional regulator [Pseudaminobacter soli (ex Li et al. 2025)]|uniref:AraC family transcriptional regulator n=1 Tax=Pseudaminobacter soli (ex Li et al. 2025) TaxID=1295366 RepID=A0A2P7SDB4_9HYPH|nr:AraC family transcriptional regulator [Mesorhizobium soli]PSJ60453.1 AraC family transcriptional regulator [Mesorhizobium soli]